MHAGLLMSSHLFKSFLRDDDEYRRCREFWAAVAADLLAVIPGSSDWEQLAPGTFADGTPMPREFEPILALRSHRVDRGLTIVQQEPTDDVAEAMATYVESYAEPIYDRTHFPSADLRILLILTEPTLVEAKALMTAWFNSASPQEMEALMREVNKRFGREGR